MDSAELRVRLHDLIERTEDRYLEAMLILLEKDVSSDTIYDQETIAMLHERMDNDEQGKSKSYTLEENWLMSVLPENRACLTSCELQLHHSVLFIEIPNP